jgi:hypothetical protein
MVDGFGTSVRQPEWDTRVVAMSRHRDNTVTLVAMDRGA